MKKRIIGIASLLLVTMSILVSTTTALAGVLIADNPAITVQGTEDFLPSVKEWWFRGGTTASFFTFTEIDTGAIPGTHVLVNFDLMITNHLNGDFGLDGLVDVTINPGVTGWTYTVAEVLLDNLDPTNHIVNWGGSGGSYDAKASMVVNKAYIRNGTLIIKVHRHTDNKDHLPVAPDSTNQPIDMSTSPPTVPAGCYDYDDAHTVHIGVKTTDATGTVADSGQVTVWVVTRGQVYADNPTIGYEGTGEDFLPSVKEWWFRGGTTASLFTFTGIDTAAIPGTHVLVNFDLMITNHLNGDFGLDGLVDVTINPGVAGWTYTTANLLLDNVDPTNHIVNWGGSGGSYDTKASMVVNKDYIRNGTLTIKVHRHTDNKDNLPVAPDSTNQPIDMSTSPPTVPAGCYDYDDAHTIHIGMKTTDETGTVADSGQVTVSSRGYEEYDATIQAYCYTCDVKGTPVEVTITMDGSPTGYTTPHTFTRLTETHTFTVPDNCSSGHPFRYWHTGETSTTITVTAGGTYIACYQVPPTPALTEWGLIILVALLVLSAWVVLRRRKAVVGRQ